MTIPPEIEQKAIEALRKLNQESDILVARFDGWIAEYPYQWVGIYGDTIIGPVPTKFRLAYLARKRGISREDILFHMTIEYLDPDPPEIIRYAYVE